MPAPAARLAPLLLVALLSVALLSRAPVRGDLQGTGQAETPGLPQSFEHAEDATGSGLAFVELGAARDTYLAGEPFALVLRFGLEREALRTGLVQLFQRPLDVPAQVFAPALESLDGAQFLDADEPSGPASASFARQDVVRAAREPDEERAAGPMPCSELERRVTVPRPRGARALRPAARLRARHALPARTSCSAQCPSIARLPSCGGAQGASDRAPARGRRSVEFTGAIGRFTIRATAEPRELGSVGR